MEARIRKWGNNLALRIPRSLAQQIDPEPDSPVTLTVNGSDLTISPVRRPRVSLDGLLAAVTRATGRARWIPARQSWRRSGERNRLGPAPGHIVWIDFNLLAGNGQAGAPPGGRALEGRMSRVRRPRSGRYAAPMPVSAKSRPLNRRGSRVASARA